jgi:NAD(P)-dependent dehydrogenase (short-subunit alcohol dehydrogenase family)
VFLYLDLRDLTTIKSSATEFLSKEEKLHVLFNNAGVMRPPQGSKTVQGYELQLGVNNIAPFLFTKLLMPTLASTAKLEPPNTVRVVWTSSTDLDAGGPKPGGVELDNLDYHVQKSPVVKYVTSKAGNYLHAVELAGRYRDAGIISIALNPGNLRTELARHLGSAFRFFVSFICYPTVNGAYTELFAGLSPDVTMKRSGGWSKSCNVDACCLLVLIISVAPFGRFMAIRPDLLEATKLETEGGTGIGAKFWEWTEEQVKPYI